MTHLLDTNACIAHLRSKHPQRTAPTIDAGPITIDYAASAILFADYESREDDLTFNDAIDGLNDEFIRLGIIGTGLEAMSACTAMKRSGSLNESSVVNPRLSIS